MILFMDVCKCDGIPMVLRVLQKYAVTVSKFRNYLKIKHFCWDAMVILSPTVLR